MSNITPRLAQSMCDFYSYLVENYQTAPKIFSIVDADENQFVIYDEYNAHISFYQHMLNDAGSSLFNKGINEIKKGDVIMVSQDHLKSLIEKTYDTKIIDTYNAVVIYQILKFKS